MENDSQITACDAKVLCYFRKHGPAPTADAKKALADVFQLLGQPVRNRRIFPPPSRSHLRDKLSINRQLSIVNTKFGICRIIGTLHNSHIV